MISTFVPQDICLASAFYKGVVDVRSIAPQNAGPGTSRANPNNIEILRRALKLALLSPKTISHDGSRGLPFVDYYLMPNFS